MKKTIASIIILYLLGLGTMQAHAQTTSVSSSLVAQPIPDRTVSYSVSASGVSKPLEWGLDCAWPNETNMRRGMAFMGANNVDLVRASFQPTDSLINGDLQQRQITDLNTRLYLIGLTGPNTKVVLNCDHPSVSSWYLGNAQRWAQLMDVTTRRVQEAGRTVVSIAPFNEPDYGWGQYTGSNGQSDFYNIAGELRNNPRFNGIRISGGNTLSCDQALPWYNALKARLDEGNTHQLAGSFDNFANFYQTVRTNGHHATGDELHNVMEAMVGAEYGMQTGIWWGTAELARGEFVKASDGVRLGYAEHRPNWSAASVYRGIDGKVQAFGGTSERQATTTTYRFVSKDKDVYYDGYGPQREYTMVMPGGTGYQQGQANAERVVNITWGEDIQPVINGRYVLVNRSSGKVLEVAGGSTTDGADVLQGTYTGATYQQWDVLPVSTRVGGDFSYFSVTAVHSGKALDDYNFSLDNGGRIAQWTNTVGVNQQRYLEYAGDGWFYIRSRHSSKCLDVAADGKIIQWDVDGGTDQQWRLVPVGAPIEFVAPGAPGNLAATANAASVRLNWTASSASDVAGYTIFRSETAGGPYNTIARNVPGTSFVDNTATAGQQYFYKIKAVDNSLNRSAYSGEVSATATGTKDLVAHFPFNGNTRDTTINLNYSASYGDVSFGAGLVGSGSISLNGTNAFVQLPATIANLQEITIATWIKWNGGGAWQRIFDFGNDQSQNMFLTPSSSAGQLRLSVNNGGIAQDLNAPALPTGTWSHVAVTLGASGARIYVNGVQVAQSSAISIRPLDFKPILNYIGRSQYPDPLLNGSLDDFKVFNYALSSAEVLALVNLGAPVAVTSPRIASGDARVILRWDAVVNTKYEVQRSDAMSGPYAVISTNADSARYVDVSVQNGNTYYYKVVAYNTEGRSTETLLTGKPALGQHVYIPFNEATGSVGEDVWGAQDATLAAAASHGTGYNSLYSLALNGTATSYATLPAGVVSTLSDFSIGAWVKPTAIDWWMRVFDFGRGTSNYMFLTLQAGWNNGVTTVRYAIKNGGSEQQVNFDYLIPWNAWTHFAVTQSGNTARLFINGNLVASNTAVTIKPTNLGNTTLNYIGKSQFPDPMLNASVDEFRIYNRALSTLEVQQWVTPSILPVTWGSFTAEKRENKGLLKWTTVQEHNVSEFIIERSINGVEFSRVGSVNAAGESNVQTSYSFTDATPLEGANYYRIRQVDKDGHYSFSIVRTVSFNGLPPVITIAPNPVKGMLSVSFPGNNKRLQAVLLNSTGQKADAFTITGQYTTHSLSHHAAGVYYLQIQGADVNVSKKLVINP